MTTTLTPHGIQTEEADYRCHVCWHAGDVYLFSTEAGLAAVRAMRASQKRPAGQDGVEGPTAEGYPVPVSEIQGIQRIPIPYDLYRQRDIKADADTETKGTRSRQLVQAMLRRGLLPLPMEGRPTSKALDIAGVDLIVVGRVTIQVKCDWHGGKGGTGNLYIQTAERNPLRRREAG